MKNVLLIDIGAGPLPVVTPVPARQSAWFPVLHIAPPLPTPPNVHTTAVADGILVEWDAVPIDGVIYVVSRAPAEAGPYVIVHRTTGLRYLHTDNTGEPSWFRVSIELNGRESAPSVPVVETPVDVTDAIAGSGQAAADALAAALAADAKAAQEIIDRQAADAQVLIDAATDATNKAQAEAQARADALLNERLAWESAVGTETTQRQSAVASLAQSLSMVSAGSGEQFDSAKIWRFDTTPDGWSGNGTPTVVDGWLRPANHATSPYVQSPDNLDVDGSAFRYLKLRIQKVGNPVWRGYAQWTTTTDNTFNTAKRAQIAEPGFDANGRATIDFDDLPWWPATIRRLRITLSAAQTATDYYLLDWVAIGRPTPGASVALVQGVEQASIDRDGANALARETLAAQLRGTYTGTDINSPLLTQGLAWSERQARVTAISAEASRTDGLISTVNTSIGAVDSRVTNVETTSANARAALAGRINTVETRMPTGTDKLANEARVVTAENAAASASGAVAGRVGTVEARMPDGTAKLAVDELNQVINPGFENDAGWTALPSTWSYYSAGAQYIHSGFRSLWMKGDGISYNAAKIPVLQDQRVFVRYAGRNNSSPPAGSYIRVGMRVSDVKGGVIGFRFVETKASAMSTNWSVIDSEVLIDIPGAAFAEVYIQASGLTTGEFFLDSIEVIPVNVASKAAFAAVTSAESASVNRDNALAERINTVETRMPTGTDQLANEARVATAEQAAADAAGANAAAITQVGARALTGVMPIIDPGFETGDGWTGTGGSAIGGNLPAATVRQSAAASTDYVHSGFYALRVNADAATRNIYSTALVPMIQGARYRITLWVRSWVSVAAGAYVRVTVRRHGLDGSYLSYIAGPSGTRIDSTGSNFGWTKLTGIYSPDANTGSAHFAVQVSGLTSGSIMIDDYTVELISEEQEQQASVTQTLRADVDSVTGKVNASHSVVLDVNGNVSGTRSENDGTKSSFSVLATVFRVISAISGMGMEWQDGYLRIWRGSGQLLLGYNFGAGDLLIWAGPNLGAAGANKANALFYIDTAGTGYFAGRVLQGVLREFKSSTTVSTTAEISTGSISSNSKPTQVIGRFQYDGTITYLGASSFITLGAGVTKADVVLERRYGTGAWTELSRRALPGREIVINENPAPSSISWSIGGELAVTDAADSRNREYRTRVISYSRREHSVTNPGTAAPIVQSQYQSIESME